MVDIGNGKNTLFSDHCWATKTPLREAALGPIPPELDGALVKEMWGEGREWKWACFGHLLPPMILKMIASHKLIEDPVWGT